MTCECDEIVLGGGEHALWYMQHAPHIEMPQCAMNDVHIYRLVVYVYRSHAYVYTEVRDAVFGDFWGGGTWGHAL